MNWRGRLNCGYTESRSIITPFVRSFSDTDKIFSFRCVHILVWILVRAIGAGDFLASPHSGQFGRQRGKKAAKVARISELVLLWISTVYLIITKR